MFKKVEDLLRDAKNLRSDHNCNFGDPIVKFQALLVAKGMRSSLNAVIKHGIQLAIHEYKRKNQDEWDAMMKEYGGFIPKKK